MHIIGKRHFEGGKPYTLDEITDMSAVSHTVVRYVLTKLQTKQLVLETNDEPTGYVPARSLDALMLDDVIKAVRSAEEEQFMSASAIKLPTEAQEVTSRMDEAVTNTLGGRTVRDLVGR